MSKNTVIYARVTNDDELLTNTFNQIHSCVEYINEVGLVLCIIFTETGISGVNKEATIIDDVLNYCIENKISHIVVTDLNRLSRKITDIQDIQALADEHGIIIHIAREIAERDAII